MMKNRISTRAPELTLPVASLAALRAALAEAVGADTAADALRNAGFAAGDALHATMTTSSDAAAMPAAAWWSQLNRLFASRGWGQLSFSEVHPGVGALDSGDWAEAAVTGDTTNPSCHFTTGVLANLLGQTAGATVAVLEVECRSRGDDRCRFLFGGADAVQAVYDGVVAGATADSAIEQLG